MIDKLLRWIPITTAVPNTHKLGLKAAYVLFRMTPVQSGDHLIEIARVAAK